MSVAGVRVSKRNNMRRRELNYDEIALLELLRGGWENHSGGWVARTRHGGGQRHPRR